MQKSSLNIIESVADATRKVRKLCWTNGGHQFASFLFLSAAYVLSHMGDPAEK